MVSEPKVVPPSFSVTSPPSASSTMSPAASKVILPEDKAMVVPSILKLSMSIPASAVILPVETSVPPTVALLLAISVPVDVIVPPADIVVPALKEPAQATVVVTVKLSKKPVSNLKPVVPKSISPSVTGLIAPSAIVNCEVPPAVKALSLIHI